MELIRSSTASRLIILLNWCLMLLGERNQQDLCMLEMRFKKSWKRVRQVSLFSFPKLEGCCMTVTQRLLFGNKFSLKLKSLRKKERRWKKKKVVFVWRLSHWFQIWYSIDMLKLSLKTLILMRYTFLQVFQWHFSMLTLSLMICKKKLVLL